ncbi:helix-turn-helix DNA-binding domain protein [Gordonia phage PhrostedPhlake]|nr:helix-turn-helix DNA-binding domain protein [Gordonia phage PhrostedPhlake]
MPNASLAQRVAGNVRAEMARIGYSQSALARKMNRTQQYVSRRVSGYVPFDVAELDEIAQILGVPIESFFREGPAVAVPA